MKRKQGNSGVQSDSPDPDSFPAFRIREIDRGDTYDIES